MNDIYRRNLAPARATDTLPFARPETFGAGVADAIGNVGATIGRINIQEKELETKRERDFQSSAAALEFAKIQESAASFALERQTSEDLAPGAAGYADAVGAYIDQESERLLGSIGDEKVRMAYQGRLAEWRGDAVIRAEAWERGQAVKLAADNLSQTLDIRANRAFRSDAEGFSGELEAWQEDLAEMRSTLPPDAFAKFEAAGVETISAQFLQGRDPEERLALLESGLFDSLDPGVVERIREGALVDQRRAKLEAEAELRVKKAEAKDAVDLVIADLGDGIPRPDADIDAAIEAARTYGLDSELRRLEKGKVENTANAEFAGASEVAIDQEVKRLNQEIATKGDKVDRETVWRRDHLTELRKTRGEQIEDDPAEFASQNGIAWQPLDFSDPAATSSSIAARRRAVSQTSSLTDRPVNFLLPAEVEQLRANLGTPQGQQMALSIARQFGRDAVKVMRQVEPDDPLLLHSLGLQPGWSQRAIEGRNLVKQKAYSPPKGLEAAIRTRLGVALNALAPEARGGVIATAGALYAEFQARRGDAGEEIDEGVVSVMVDRALGNNDTKRGDRGGKGGLAYWNGRPFVLPVTMTGDEFSRRLSFGKLNGGYRDDLETPVTADELRDEFTPVRIAGNLYGFQNERREWVLAANGDRAVIDISKLTAAPAEEKAFGSARKQGPSHVWVAPSSKAKPTPYDKVRY